MMRTMTETTPTPSSADKAPSLLRSGMVVSIMTMLSRVLGMVRDVVVAAYFGSKSEADAFFIAFKIPNFLRRLFAEGAFAQAFVPVLSEYRTRYTLAEVQNLVNQVTGTLGITLAGITLLGVAGAPVLITLFAPGFYGRSEEHTSELQSRPHLVCRLLLEKKK